MLGCRMNGRVRRAAIIGAGYALTRLALSLDLTAYAAEAPMPAPSILQAALTASAKGDWQNAWFGFWTLARQGDPIAEFDLAQLYRLGRGIPQDLQQAFYWYGKAAAQGHAYAEFNLGVMYELGQATPRDLGQARIWYGRAAAQNIAAAADALRRLNGPPNGGQ